MVKEVKGVPGRVTALAVSPDGKLFAAIYSTVKVGFFDSASFKLLKKVVCSEVCVICIVVNIQ